MTQAQQSQWDGRDQGGLLKLRLASLCLRLIGGSGSRLLSYPLALVGLFGSARGRLEVGRYLKRLRPELSGDERLGLIWRQFASFGRILGDRGLVYMRGGRLHCRHRGGEHLRAALGGERGCILLSAHVGNWELAGRLLGRIGSGKRVHLVNVENEDPRERAYIEAHMRDARPAIIDPRDAMAAALQINAALGNGDVVCMLGDRHVPGQETVRVPFLGKPAQFPIGPFHVAAVTGAPVLFCFLMKAGDVYELHVSKPLYVARPRGRRERQAAIVAAVQAWASALEQTVQRYPLQWHNFYDFWR